MKRGITHLVSVTIKRNNVKKLSSCSNCSTASFSSSAKLNAESGAQKQNKTAVVFGGSGFIGRSVVQHLAPHFETVKIAAYDPVEFNAGDNVKFEQLDATDKHSVYKALEGADAVVNVVGIPYESFHTYEQVRIEAVSNIAHSAKIAGVPNFVHVGCLSSTLDSDSRYYDTLARGEDMARAAFPGATILRPGPVYGPHDRFFNRLLSAAQKMPFVPYPNVDFRFQPVFVEDVSRAVLKAVQDQRAKDKVFELGGPEVFTIPEFLNTAFRIARIHRKPVPVHPALIHGLTAVYQWLPDPIVTRDYLPILKRHVVVSEDAHTFRDLALIPRSFEEGFGSYH